MDMGDEFFLRKKLISIVFKNLMRLSESFADGVLIGIFT
jgi:hypothetical protein